MDTETPLVLSSSKLPEKILISVFIAKFSCIPASFEHSILGMIIFRDTSKC